MSLTTPSERQQIAANGRLDAWQRLGPLLSALHVPAGTGLQVVAEWLEGARPTQRSEAQRLLRALQRQRWAVAAPPRTGLPGRGHDSAPAGLLIRAGQTTWWLRFATQPTLHVQAIERFTGGAGQ
jgi:hypothetical protein